MVTRTNSVDTWDEIDYKALNVSTHLASTSGKIMMNWKADGTGFEYTIFGAHDYGDCTPFNIYPSYVGPWMYELLVTITSNAWTTYTSITNK